MLVPGHSIPISGVGQASELSGSSGRGKQAPFKAVWRNKDYPISRSLGAKTCSGFVFLACTMQHGLF